MQALEPDRPVTRFLVPLADIMALLFSLFLLLPHLEQQPGTHQSAAMAPGALWTPLEQQQVQQELARLQRLQQLPIDEKIYIVVMDIDGDTGDLQLRQGTKLLTVNEQNIDQVISQHKQEARRKQQDLFYILRVPLPDASGTKPHPNIASEKRYQIWFHERGKVNYEIKYLRLLPT